MPVASSLAEARLAQLKRLRELQLLQQRLNDEVDGFTKPKWRDIARPEQIAPAGDWFCWTILAGRGWGKAISLSTMIPVPAGWKKMEEIQPGDEVFDESGRVCRVTATFDRVPRRAYRVHFSDLTYIDACDEHQWVTWTQKDIRALQWCQRDEQRKVFPSEWPSWVMTTRGHNHGQWEYGPKIRTTEDILKSVSIKSVANHCIPTCGELDLPDVSLPIDPYVLGVWLGDGTRGYATFVSMDSDICENMRAVGMDVQFRNADPGAGPAFEYKFNFADGRKARGALNQLSVLWDKHVPSMYLRASAAQRLALLQGLMDTDGCGGRSGNHCVKFTNKNYRLIEAVAELARSLGQRPRVVQRHSVKHGITFPYWDVAWSATIPVFRLPRKLSTITPLGGRSSLQHQYRRVVRVEPIDPVPMKCLTVDSKHATFLAGEAMIPTHNSRTAAEWCAEKARQYPRSRFHLVGKTFADVRDTMIEGESGLLACFNRDEFPNQSEDDGYNRSSLSVRLANGSMFKSFSAEKPWRLRGPQCHFAWADEACFWRDAHKGLIADTTWSNLVITMRLPKRLEWDEDYRTQVVIATTPRPVALLRTSDPDPSRMGILQRPTTVITRGRTMDNIENLTKSYQENVIAPLLGTRLGRQELEAEILDDVPGALWQRDWFDECRVTDPASVPDLIRVVVAVDPAVTDGESSAQTGIIVAGAAKNGRGYVLGDFTLRATPMEAMKKIVAVYEEFKADRVIAEVNNGGDYIGTLLKTVDPNVPFQQVRATRGKAIRAEPVSSLYEQRRISHVGSLPYLEDQCCAWVPGEGESPDRIDALVWGITSLKDLIGGSFLSAYGVIRCESCQHAFIAVDPATQQPRMACPKCSAPVILGDGL